jgi:hypothetical protein
MKGPRSVEFAGTDEELEKLLREFARTVWARLAPDRRGGWLLSFGSFLSTNPNDVSFRLRVLREGAGVAFRPSAVVAPWSRAKTARIVAYRAGQLADYLTSRLRGAGPEKFDAGRLREPFSSWGSGPAALSASFAWVAAAGVLVLLVSTLATAVATLPLIGATIAEIRAQALLLASAGAIPLPSLAELERTGFGFRLATAFVGGVPLAFFAGLLHVVALAAGEASLRGSRLPQATFAFLALFLFLAFRPYTPLLALPCALLVPTALQAAYTAVASRRRERVRDGPRPRRSVVAVALLLAGGALAFAAPAVARGDDFTLKVALFRDRTLLGHPFGKAVAAAYYRTTLYTAWPLKEVFAGGPGRPQHLQRTAVADAPGSEAPLRALHFTIVPEGSAADVVVTRGAVEARGEKVPLSDPRSEAELRRALDLLSRETFRGGVLRSLSGLGWTSLVYAGPPAVILIVIGICCPFVSIMYRAMSVRAATIALGACGAVTLLLMLLGEAALGELGATLVRLRAHPEPGALRDGLRHPSVVVRHEAAVLAHQHPHASLAAALRTAAADPDLRVRLWACAALGKTGDPAALQPLIDRLDDAEIFVRYRAAEGLGHLKKAEAVDALLRMMKERTWYEGLYALEALRRIDPSRF